MNKKLEPSLNPNATEFVPFTLRSSGKSVLDRSESSVSTNSEEDALQYWGYNLPDDITPDFKVVGSHNTPEINSLPFSNLSLTDNSVGSLMSIPAHRLCVAGQAGQADMAHFESSASTRSDSMLKPHPFNGNSDAVNQGYPVSFFGENLSPTRFQPCLAKSLEKQIVRNDQHSTVQRCRFSGNSSRRFLADMLNELDHEDVGALEFLASLFPGLASGSLAEVYVANGGDLNLTIEVLSRHEGDGGFNQTLNSEAISSRNLNALNYPSHFAPGDHQNLTPYRSYVKDSTLPIRSFSSIPSRGATDFTSAVRKMGPSHDSSIWKYERNGCSGPSIGPSRSSQVLASSYNSAQGKHICGDRLLNQGVAHASPLWPETEETVGNVYSEMREEARDHAHLANAYFEQAQQAYLIGNKVLSKELSIKGQLHSLKIRTAQESIYRRNPENGRVRIIDLHGLGASEAIHVVKQELVFLRDVVRSTDQHVVVYIHVGTRGPRTPARLPTAVQQCLLEEGLDYSEPQPGVLQVVLFCKDIFYKLH